MIAKNILIKAAATKCNDPATRFGAKSRAKKKPAEPSLLRRNKIIISLFIRFCRLSLFNPELRVLYHRQNYMRLMFLIMINLLLCCYKLGLRLIMPACIQIARK